MPLSGILCERYIVVCLVLKKQEQVKIGADVDQMVDKDHGKVHGEEEYHCIVGQLFRPGIHTTLEQGKGKGLKTMRFYKVEAVGEMNKQTQLRHQDREHDELILFVNPLDVSI